MKLTVENLGRIKKAEIEIRPLTVFIGENNTNKTWTAYALFGLLEGLRWNRRRAPDQFSYDRQIRDAIESVARSILASEDTSVRESEHTVGRRSLIPKRGGVRFSVTAVGLAELVGAEAADASASLEISAVDFARGPVHELQVRVSSAEESATGVYRAAGGRALLNAVTDLNELEDLLEDLALAHFNNAWCLPSERILALNLSQSILANGTGGELAGPVRDFALHVGATGGLAKGGRLTELLATIVGGRYQRAARSKPLQFVPEAPDDLAPMPVSAAASLVKSLAGLDLFLREATPGDVLLIDEPEMNAHPKAQAQTAELLAMLANAGITVVVTTHSPYFVDHLTNLMEGAHLEGKKKSAVAKRLYLADQAALIDPEKVAVWGFAERPKHREEVEVHDVLDRKKRRVSWDTFGHISDEVGNLYSRILELDRGVR